MKILITGICGFVGSTIALALLRETEGLQIIGIDNFSRSGSWLNRAKLQQAGIQVVHGDIRKASDLEALGPFDWILDAAANPSVLAGVDGKSSSRQLVEHNLGGTINLLECCKTWGAGFLLLSTSRVYSIPPLANLEVEAVAGAYRPTSSALLPGLSERGIAESFSTAPPVSLYGSTKLTSEALALEYGLTFDFPVWINRCGVMAGAGQFGKPDQGIFAFWIHSWREGRPLKYIGFDGLGHQVRDCLHPRDLAPLLYQQMQHRKEKGEKPSVVNLSGGRASAFSLRQLSDWCEARYPDSSTPHHEASRLPKEGNQTDEIATRPFDLPWVVLDNTLASESWGWQSTMSLNSILDEIADFAESSSDWISTSH